ncbi:MAG: hypothetical protein AB1505_06685 [Candidatus Latescibacterota bacterium]
MPGETPWRIAASRALLLAPGLLVGCLFTTAWAKEEAPTMTAPQPAAPAVRSPVIADHRVADQTSLRAIPTRYIDAARRSFHVAYMHTSHGTHVTFGVYGLPGFRPGDEALFGVTANAATPDPDKLDFNDYAFTHKPPDLSQADGDWDAWLATVRAYLDDPANARINVMMWSWCNIGGHDVPAYLRSMQTAIDEYGPGGARVGTGAGKTRSTPVTFVFMTGHANRGANAGPGNPRDQARAVIDYCTAHGYPCLDYYGIDTHAMDGTYYEDAGDDGDSEAYRAAMGCSTVHREPGTGADGTVVNCSYFSHWQDAHAVGTDWYENRSAPGGEAIFGAHTYQHLTANRKAFAFWYLLARLAGWES